jgi:hypothetical protein
MKKQKKLRLHRETIQPLDLYRELGRVQGGIDITGCEPGCGKEEF